MRHLGSVPAVVDVETEIAGYDQLLHDLVMAVAPAMLNHHAVGVDTASALLVAAGDNPERLRSEAAWARLCGVAPVPASSGASCPDRHPRPPHRDLSLGPPTTSR